MSFFDYLETVSHRNSVYDRHGDEAQWHVKCTVCSSGTMLAVARGHTPAAYRDLSLVDDGCAWLMCSACGMGAFAIGDAYKQRMVFPKPSPFDTPDHLPKDLEQTWLEARRSFSISAFTGSALMCRKIIFHLAVDAGLPSKNEKGFAPRFEDCVDHLVAEEYITARHKRQWVDSIRKWGNVATHELAPINEQVAYSALEFTRHLLIQVYTFPKEAEINSAD